MSTWFDIPLQLVMILSLVTAGGDGRLPPQAVAMSAATAKENPDPYRFSEQGWLRALHLGAGGDVLESFRSRIFKTSGGRYYVPAEADRRPILELRRDGEVAALVALDLGRRNADALQQRLGRSATMAELYLAHELGHEAAFDVVIAGMRTPSRSLADVVPDVRTVSPYLVTAHIADLPVGRLQAKLTRAVAALTLSRPQSESAVRSAERAPVEEIASQRAELIADVSRGAAVAGWRTEVRPAR